MDRFEFTPWRSYSTIQKLCTLGLLGLWAFSAYKIYGVLRFGEIFGKGRTGWFSYADDPDRYVWQVVMNSAVVALPAFLALLVVALRLVNNRRDRASAKDAADGTSPPPIIKGLDER